MVNEKCDCCDKSFGKMVPLKDVAFDEKSSNQQKEMWNKCGGLIIRPENINFAEI